MMKMVRAIYPGVLLGCLMSCGALGCRETVATSYRSFDEAEKAEAIKRGWIPVIVPRDATAIVEVHDLDTNEGCGRFTTKRPQDLKMAPLANQRLKHDAPATWCQEIADWQKFADALASRGSHEMTVGRSIEDRGVILGVADEGRLVFFWTPKE